MTFVKLTGLWGVVNPWAKAHYTYFDFWGFKYHLICKIGLKLSTFFDFILSWSWKKSFYYPFQRAGGTPTVPWVMAYTLLNGFLQNISLICAVTSTILKRTTYATFFWTFFVVWSEENRFDTHFNGLDGYQQSHGWCPISHQWVVTKKVDQK